MIAPTKVQGSTLRLAIASSCLLGVSACGAEAAEDGAEPSLSTQQLAQQESTSVPTDWENVGETAESICGPSTDWQEVERYDGSLGVTQAFVRQHQRSVGHLEGIGCTGTLISRDLFLSAGHCGYAVGQQVSFNYQIDGSSSASNVRPKDIYQVSEVIEQRFDEVDYAIVRLSGSPGDVYGYTPVLNRDPEVGSLAAVIQHPSFATKKVHTGKIVDYFSFQGPSWYRHEVDTTGGSSGAGMLSPEGFLVGVHTNAGCEQSFPTEGNSAVRMTSIIENSLTLRALANGDVPLVGDFDSDGRRDDLGVWRPASGTWHAVRTDGSVIFDSVQWGTQGDIPLVGDFDSDGQFDDLGIWRPSSGTWWAKRSNGSIIFAAVQWGTQGDIPVVGDFDSDLRIDDLGIWRPSTGTWWAKRANNTIIFSALQWGTRGDVPLVGDFDSDGQVDDLGVWRPSNGTWWAKRTNNRVIASGLSWGVLGDVPFVGDFDGNGKFDDLGVWRPSNGTWWARRMNNKVLVNGLQAGFTGDIPLVGDLDGDLALDDLTTWNASQASWSALRSNNTAIFSGLLFGIPH